MKAGRRLQCFKGNKIFTLIWMWIYLSGKSCFTGRGRVEWDTQSRGGSVLLCFSAVGINWGHGWFVWLHLHTFSHCVGNFEISWKSCSAFSIFTCAVLFSCSPTGPSFALFHHQYSIFHLFHTEMLIFHIHLTKWKEVSLRKCGSFWAKSALPNVCLKDVISMEGTNDNQPKSKPLGSKLQQRALWTVLCQTFKPVWEAVLKRITFKPEALGAIK